MASRNIQDAFMDDSDETCPLCVEEFDLSDKNFRPCPCGYQVCQFCYNNIKNNMNGLCPACRRPYDEQSIEWKIVSPEEQRADIELQARKKAAARKKESERKQVETNNRKHLAGLRVVQKNLVYVVGLSQKSNEEEFLQTLRGDQYFGQYGKIIKIVVSKAKEGSHNNSVGVYVTFEKREDAAKCIAAVDGSRNLDRPLRAQYGTTKYCSAYLRNEQCQNRNCTFLHETGEDNDSFSRQDLSSMNAMSTQRPAQSASSSSMPIRQYPHPQAPPQQAPQSIAATTTTSSGAQQIARDEAMSRSDSGDGSALPSSASWAAKNTTTVESRRSSKPTSISTPSPVITSSHLSHATEAPPQPEQQVELPQPPPQSQPLSSTGDSHQPLKTMTTRPKSPCPIERAMRVVCESDWSYTLDRSLWSEHDLKVIENYPPLFADNGGWIRYQMEKEEEQERLKQEEERNVLGAMSAAEEDENPASGSFQLGGEPETQGDSGESTGRLSAQQQRAIQPPYSSSNTFPFGNAFQQANAAANLPRTLTPQQQHQLSLLRSGSSRDSSASHGQFQTGYGQTSLHQHQQSNPFQMQMQNQGFGSAQGHARQASRFTFANDTASASTAVKPAVNPQLMAQQSAMMPPNHNKQYQQQSNAQNSHFYSGVQGPPPGLKSSGTPPISGGGMFGQGHGFASAMGGSAGGFGGNNGSGNKNSNEELMRDFMRNRNGSLNGQGPDLGKQSSFAPRYFDAAASSKVDSLVKETNDPFNFTSTQTEQPGQFPTLTQAPPGLSSPQDFPPLAAPSQPPAPPPKTIRKTATAGVTPSIKPAVPVVLPAATVKVAPTSKPQPSNDHQNKDHQELTNSTEQTTAELTANLKKGKPLVSDHNRQDPKAAASSLPHVDEKKHAESSKSSTKRPKPNTLSINIGKDASSKEKEAGSSKAPYEDTSAKPESKTDAAQISGSSQPATPSTTLSHPSAPSSTRQSQSKLAKSADVSKADTGSPSVPPSVKSASRKPSIASLNQPGTPASEKVSDNASYTSNPVSRANSPPPSKVGTAATRHVSKSQQKKERQARAKQAEEAVKKEDLSGKAEEEVVQAPIVGRKKKTKKTKETNGVTSESTPTVTRPVSPEPSKAGGGAGEKIEQPMQPAEPPKHAQESKAEATSKATESEIVSGLAPASSYAATLSDEQPQKESKLNPASIFADLQAAGGLSASAIDTFLKPVPSINTRYYDPNLDPQLIFTQHKPLTPEQNVELAKGNPVNIIYNKHNAVVVLPDRRCLRGFSPAAAERYIQSYLTVSSCKTPFNPNKSNDTLVEDKSMHHLVDGIITSYTAHATSDPSSSVSDLLNFSLRARSQQEAQAPAASVSSDHSLATAAQPTTLYNRFAEQASQHHPLSVSPYPYNTMTAPAPSSASLAKSSSPPLPASSAFLHRAGGGGAVVNRLVNQQQQHAAAGKPDKQEPILSVDDAEARLAADRKNAEAIEKRLNALIRRNRKLFLGGGGPTGAATVGN